MYISNEELEKIKEYVDNLYWDQDRMSRDGRYFLNKLDNYIKKLEKEKENNIYVITNNAVVDDEIDYSIYGVATDINEAKKIFNQAVKDAKTDSDFDNLNAIEENSPNFKNKAGEMTNEVIAAIVLVITPPKYGIKFAIIAKTPSKIAFG